MNVFPLQRQRPIRISTFSRTSDSSTRAGLHSDHSIPALQLGQVSASSSVILETTARYPRAGGAIGSSQAHPPVFASHGGGERAEASGAVHYDLLPTDDESDLSAELKLVHPVAFSACPSPRGRSSGSASGSASSKEAPALEGSSTTDPPC